MDIARLRFLVVEDHTFQRWVAETALKTLGAHFVRNAENGVAALQLLGDIDHPIDIVISDLEMPQMDGMELIRRLGERSDASVIVASGLDPALVSSVEMMARAYEVPLLGSVDKPVTPDKLLPLVERYRPSSRVAATSAPTPRHFSVEEILAGLRSGQIEAFFQPKVSMKSGVVVGAEALARWRHPEEGLVGPVSFIPALERSGDLASLTETVARSASTSCRLWRDLGVKTGVSINISQESLADLRLAERMIRVVAEAGLTPADVTFEVTESTMVIDLGRALENLSRLRMKGFGLSIDDYGTGYSSMEQLARIAFTELKIDRSFVRNATEVTARRAVLESSLEIAGKLHIPAVAEGVESREEWDLLRGLNCDLAQGYYIARPMDGPAFVAWLTERGNANGAVGVAGPAVPKPAQRSRSVRGRPARKTVVSWRLDRKVAVTFAIWLLGLVVLAVTLSILIV